MASNQSVPGACRFTGKVAIVTGASAGLGLVLAAMLAKEGARVLMAARRLELVQSAAAGIGDTAIAVRADVTQETDVIAMVDAALSHWGQIDILFNNAASPGVEMPIWEQTLENWDATFNINLTASMLCNRKVLRRSMLARRSGAIVNFSSGGGWNAVPRMGHYCTSKAALRMLTKSIALEAGPYGVRCNCVVPGRIETDMLRQWVERQAKAEGVPYEVKRAQGLANVPLKTISTTEDVANLALFLASDAARTITGQSVNVDAGAMMLG
jgi:3-oxoacyl-[acyl-carrier protein] reductase